MKTYREFVAEVARPVAGDEINFLNKHVTILIDYPIDVEDQFTGGDISKFTRLADYKKGQDKAVYEANINLKGDDAVNDGECKRHKKQEIIKKIIDDNSLDEDFKQEFEEILNSLTEANLEYAIENGIDLVDFVKKLMP